MIYHEFQDLKLSALGMGCMRLPVVGGKDDQVDEAAAEAMVDLAMARGVNYYDTAWGLPQRALGDRSGQGPGQVPPGVLLPGR